MISSRPLALTAAAATAGALLALALSLILLGVKETSHLVIPFAIGIALTVAVTAVATRLSVGGSLRLRFTAVAGFATVIGLTNLGVLAWQMLVSDRDALLIAILLIYSSAAAIGAGLATARASTSALERLTEAADQMAAGNLSTRAGHVGGGRELERLGRRLDEMARSLERARAREQSAEAQRRDLIVAVSHDLRTPLADLRAMNEAIIDGVVEDPETIDRYMRRMGEAIGSLSELVDDLFEFVQLDAGAIEAESERALIEDVVSTAIAACDGQAEEKRLVLLTDLGEAARLTCSPRLTRVVQNLLQNAIRHTPADGTVRVAARVTGSRFELAVEDSGEGIEPAALERVFEPFWRGDAARESDGAGLGLALAKRIVEALGGSIAVESAPSHGSRFAVLIPHHRLQAPS